MENIIQFKSVHDVKRYHDPDYRRKANAAATLKRLAEENSQDYYVFFLSQHKDHINRAKEKRERLTRPKPKTLRQKIAAVIAGGEGVIA